MPNKRKLKKSVNALCGMLYAECLASRSYSTNQLEDIDNIVLTITCMQNDLVCRISHPEPGMKPSLFFQALNNDMKKQTADIVEQLMQLC